MRIIVLVAAEPELGQPLLRGRAPLATGISSISSPSSTFWIAVRHGSRRSFWNTIAILPRNEFEFREGIAAVDPHCAAARRGQPGDHVEDGRLAAAGLAEQRQHLAGANVEIETVHGAEGG